MSENVVLLDREQDKRLAQLITAMAGARSSGPAFERLVDQLYESRRGCEKVVEEFSADMEAFKAKPRAERDVPLLPPVVRSQPLEPRSALLQRVATLEGQMQALMTMLGGDQSRSLEASEVVRKIRGAEMTIKILLDRRADVAMICLAIGARTSGAAFEQMVDQLYAERRRSAEIVEQFCAEMEALRAELREERAKRAQLQVLGEWQPHERARMQ
jgi:hypothetical protein